MAHPLLALVAAPPDHDAPFRTPSLSRHAARDDNADVAALGADIVARIRAGDARAFESVVREYFTPLARFVFGFVQSYEDAEDVVQEVLCRVWERRDAWAPGAGVRAYLFAAARNRALNLRAHELVVSRTRVAVRDAFGEPPFESADADEELQESLRRLRLATDALSERQRLALHLRYEQGLTVPEVAHVLEISPRPTERLLARALDALRGALTR